MNWRLELCMKKIADIVSLRMSRMSCQHSPMEDEKKAYIN